jgi:hypothetical protein
LAAFRAAFVFQLDFWVIQNASNPVGVKSRDVTSQSGTLLKSFSKTGFWGYF